MKKLLLLSLALITSETVADCISVHAHKPFKAKYVNSKKGCIGLCAKQKVYTKFNGTWRQGTKVSICDCCKPTRPIPPNTPTCIDVFLSEAFMGTPDLKENSSAIYLVTPNEQAQKDCPKICAKQPIHTKFNGSWSNLGYETKSKAVGASCSCCLPTK